MRKRRAIGTFAVALKVLSDDGCNSHGYANDTVVVDADPIDVEPCQATLGGPPRAALTPAAGGKPVHGPDPVLDGIHIAEIFLLIV